MCPPHLSSSPSSSFPPAFFSLALNSQLRTVTGVCSRSQFTRAISVPKSRTRISARSDFFKEVTNNLVVWFGSANDSVYRIVLNLHVDLPSRFFSLCLCGCSVVLVSAYISEYIFQVRYVHGKCTETYLLATSDRCSTGSAYIFPAAGTLISPKFYRKSPPISTLKSCNNCRQITDFRALPAFRGKTFHRQLFVDARFMDTNISPTLVMRIARCREIFSQLCHWPADPSTQLRGDILRRLITRTLNHVAHLHAICGENLK